MVEFGWFRMLLNLIQHCLKKMSEKKIELHKRLLYTFLGRRLLVNCSIIELIAKKKLHAT